MTDKAKGWVTSYFSARKSVSWDEFIVDVTGRFRDESGSNIVELFNKLHQIDDLEAYVDEFENLRSVMLQSNHVLPEVYILNSFIGGLKPTIKPFVKAFKPVSITDAIEYARLQEESLQVNRNYKTPYQSKPMLANIKLPLLPTPNVVTKGVTSNLGIQHNSSRNNKYIPADIRAEKIAKGLWYFSDQKYERGHKCKFKEPQLFTVEVPGDEVDKCDEWCDVDEGCGENELSGVKEAVISVNALAGNQNFQTMRVKGFVKGKMVHILIDTGSTHNFLDEGLAKEIGVDIEEIPSQMITVADGNQMAYDKICKKFEWGMSDIDFCTEVMLIGLGSCDMGLGIQWLSTLGLVYWDFKKLRMDFVINDNSITLKGVPAKKLKVSENGPTQKMLKNAAQLCFLQLVHTQKDFEHKISAIQENVEFLELTELKSKFEEVFKEPTELPPSRGIMDHQNPLIDGASPVNIRPYRYPLKQKDVIEQLVQEMLDRGIIQDSTSPFASPVVLVGKKDGTWRLCIDYRELNKRTVKDKFPIPIIEELMDELAGSTIFSKLDLRAGYHQMRLHQDDVFKTAFKTHIGHYEFLVMPFRLTNAPASFQRWMNSVFKPLLRKSVLVFFDDILVYSKNLADHWVHLEEVFQLMISNQLYAKESKCSFAVYKIEYLGHFISVEGITTDSRKVQAVANWPVPKSLKQLRSFLGLSGYYRKFVKSYAILCKPLTDLLKKGAFSWNDQVQHAFEVVKQALMTAPVLALPNFSKIFIIETDASQRGI
ncbi:uncharacterized protein LOC141665350 [Apium graveolens]|uniref:uncharacterized protein LOC141665350 n=1 Tax=Apium graveolens TaxID=4045 RepID=UPI003D7A4F4A